ncbi:DUF1499 domain-containing protein [Gemmobacter aquarius]|uniref:DUF1499 domain-containing protein n=2 Tax=Paragemmobacter aquarius TaxID=2169400 RepID=A0A2S0UR68_9RHOB|nr:DUF1499 domain-containing protein [Gemmobacter aquarius]
MFLALLAVVATAAFAAYVRLAPSDPGRWNTDLLTDRAADCAVAAAEGSARFACLYDMPPETLLQRLDAIALAPPRTMRLAGDPASGRITWVTRSALWGFPDYTTAQATSTPQGTRLDLYARLRFGRSDMGVNAARLTDWTAQLTLR